MTKKYSYLALGDSYTTGESVPLQDNFPYKTVQLLRENGQHFYAPEIVAQTGWSSDELISNLNQTKTLARYDFVSLLIGVNNQYREKDVVDFIVDFETLIQRSLNYTDQLSQNVFVLSIPDWGITPFAEGRDINKIATEIDSYNEICAQLCRKHKITFIEITAEQRKYGASGDYLANDGLHPNGKEYSKWAEQLSAGIKSVLIKND